MTSLSASNCIVHSRRPSSRSLYARSWRFVERGVEAVFGELLGVADASHRTRARAEGGHDLLVPHPFVRVYQDADTGKSSGLVVTSTQHLPQPRLLVVTETHHIDLNCRVSWGKVVKVDGPELVVEQSSLLIIEGKLALGPPAPMRAVRQIEARGFADTAAIRDWVSLHWGWVCEVITPRQQANLARFTDHQLRIANETI